MAKTLPVQGIFSSQATSLAIIFSCNQINIEMSLNPHIKNHAITYTFPLIQDSNSCLTAAAGFYPLFSLI